MPYTKPLTKIGREEERRQKRTLIFREAVGGRLAALRMQKKDIAELTGLAESTKLSGFWARQESPGLWSSILLKTTGGSCNGVIFIRI